jgi:polyisoprenoid-binding protein YceI
LSDVSGTLTVDERDPAHSHVTVTIGTTSLDTKRPARDTHLRSADFFDVARYPSMTFTSQRIEALDQAAGHYRVTGTLTIREISHEVSLDVWHVSPASTEEGRLTLTSRRSGRRKRSRRIRKVLEICRMEQQQERTKSNGRPW